MGHPLLDLTNKTAVVIGGTSGIGLALAQGLAEAGANVVPTGRRDEQVRQQIGSHGDPWSRDGEILVRGQQRDAHNQDAKDRRRKEVNRRKRDAAEDET